MGEHSKGRHESLGPVPLHKRINLRLHLINPSDTAFGTAVITPRWLFVLAAATPEQFGDPILCDETLEPLDVDTIAAGDIVGIGIHTGNALRGYAIGRLVKQRGAFVVFGGIHTTLYPEEAFERGAADCVVRGDGDMAWGQALEITREALRSVSMKAAAWMPATSKWRAGTCWTPPNTCGPPSKPFAGVRNIALLLCVADRRPTSAAKAFGPSDRRNRPTPAPRVPLHCTC